MNRAPSLLVATVLALALFGAVEVGPALAGDPPTPATAPTANGTGGYDPTADPAVPYIVALLVTGGGLLLVGLVAMQQQRATVRRRAVRRGGWTCAACAAGNAPDRSTCFACHATRAAADASATSGPGTGATQVPDPTAEGHSA